MRQQLLTFSKRGVSKSQMDAAIAAAGGGGLSESAITDLITAASPVLDIRTYGGVGDDSTDNSAAFAAAMADLPDGQGTIVFPPDADNIYQLGGLTIDRPDVVIRAPGVILKSNSADPVFTVENGTGSALGAIFEYVTINGNGANVTCKGIYWVHGGRSKMIGCRIYDTADYCMDFAVDAGSRFLCQTSTFARYLGMAGETNDGVCAIRLPFDLDSVGRDFLACSADCKMIEDGGSVSAINSDVPVPASCISPRPIPSPRPLLPVISWSGIRARRSNGSSAPQSDTY